MEQETDRDSTTEQIETLILDGPPYGPDGRPFATLPDLADQVDVSPQTVRRRVDTVADHPAIETATVGQATVMWRSFDVDAGWADDLPDDSRKEVMNEYFRVKEDALMAVRARWLQTKQEVVSGETPTTPANRWELWQLIGRYLQVVDDLGQVPLVVAAAKAPLADEHKALLDLSEVAEDIPALPEGFRTEGFKRRLYGVELFESPVGEVVGLGSLLPHYAWTAEQLDESPDADALDTYVPAMKDLLYAGDVLDQFVSQLYGYFW